MLAAATSPHLLLCPGVRLQDSHNERVQRDSRSGGVHGHIIALPFSDSYLDAVVEAVLNTGVHRIADPDVKYAIAAHVEPLGHSFVCCMWIYLAAVRDGAVHAL